MFTFVVAFEKVVCSILLVAGNKVRVVNGFHGLVVPHEWFKFLLKLVIKDLSSFHS